MRRGTLTSYVSTDTLKRSRLYQRQGPHVENRGPESGAYRHPSSIARLRAIYHDSPFRSEAFVDSPSHITPGSGTRAEPKPGVLLRSEGESDATRREYLGIMARHVGPCKLHKG
jgi:hypothetical protein